MGKSKGPTPILLDRQDIVLFLGVTEKQAERATKALQPHGFKYRTDNPLFSTKEVKQWLKQH